MLKYVIRRLAATAVILTLVSMSVFVIFAVLPMDPAKLTCGKACFPAVVEANRHRLGLDVPVHVQYGRFVKGLFVGREYGDGAAKFECPAPAFGYSFNRHACVTDLIKQAFPVTFSLAIGAFTLWLSVGVLLGVVAARRKGKWQDRASTVFVLVGTSLPTFISGLLILIFVALKFKLLNPLDMGQWVSPLENPFKWFNIFIFPWTTLALASAASYTRFTRSNFLETENEDYIRTARAKGLTERTTIMRHAFRNTLIPLTTIMVVDFAGIIGGAIITERVFGWYGMGTLFNRAIQGQDLNLLMGVFFLTASLTVLANLVADLLYSALDPRIRVEAGK